MEVNVMALTRWQPFPEIGSLQQCLNRLFDEFPFAVNREGAKIPLPPPVEIEETEETIHLRLEIPGIDPENLDVRVASHCVTISGDRQSYSQLEQQALDAKRVSLRPISAARVQKRHLEPNSTKSRTRSTQYRPS